MEGLKDLTIGFYQTKELEVSLLTITKLLNEVRGTKDYFTLRLLGLAINDIEESIKKRSEREQLNA